MLVSVKHKEIFCWFNRVLKQTKYLKILHLSYLYQPSFMRSKLCRPLMSTPPSSSFNLALPKYQPREAIVEHKEIFVMATGFEAYFGGVLRGLQDLKVAFLGFKIEIRSRQN